MHLMIYIIQILLFVIFFAGCQSNGSDGLREDKKNNAIFMRIWKEYHDLLFDKGLKKKVTQKEKVTMFQKIGKRYYFSEEKIKEIMLKKYPDYYQSLFGSSKLEPKPPN